MKVLKEIKMKCTREEYDSIKHLVGELAVSDKKDFEDYNYLVTDLQDNNVYMFYGDEEAYEKFDKNIFLNAYGTETPKISIDYNYEKLVSLTRLEIETILGYKIKIVK